MAKPILAVRADIPAASRLNTMLVARPGGSGRAERWVLHRQEVVASTVGIVARGQAVRRVSTSCRATAPQARPPAYQHYAGGRVQIRHASKRRPPMQPAMEANRPCAFHLRAEGKESKANAVLPVATGMQSRATGPHQHLIFGRRRCMSDTSLAPTRGSSRP